MFKKTIKLVGLLLLLVLSFIYTDSVFKTARKNDPIMIEVLNYKKDNDINPKEPIINEDEIILGASGIIVNAKKSYDNMKDNEKFDENKIIYDDKKPKETISKTYKYYIKKGNAEKKQVSLVFKINDNKNYNNLLTLLNKYDTKVNFFIDGAVLEDNVNMAFEMVNFNHEIYNLGYNGKYNKHMISVTNNLIESISLKDANLCLNDIKDDYQKDICSKRKMHSITSTLKDADIKTIKKELKPGAIITYDLDSFDISKLGIMINTITSRGYNIVPLSNLIKE